MGLTNSILRSEFCEFVYDTSQVIQDFVSSLDPDLSDTEQLISTDDRDCLFSDDYLLEILP